MVELMACWHSIPKLVKLGSYLFAGYVVLEAAILVFLVVALFIFFLMWSDDD